MQKYSKKFWIFFWLISAGFLSVWFLFWNIKFHGLSSTMNPIIEALPLPIQTKNEYIALITILDDLAAKDNQEKTFLVLFQNSLEIRPGGGFIGSFAVLKIKNGKVASFQTHDVSNFDARIPNVQNSPYPIGEIMHTQFWKLRDSNFSPDFQVDAAKAKELYSLGQGQENFDGVIGITSNVLTSILNITGPVSIEGYPGTYDTNNAIVALEYQVEKAFADQGIAREQRKSVMGDLAKELQAKILFFSLLQKINLAKAIITDLEEKDIQLQFNDKKMQAAVDDANWSGKIDTQWNKDFLAVIDANLGAYKSDYYIKRNIDYAVDFSGQTPTAHLKVTYAHTATQKDWMTTNYLTYLRVYVPQGSNLVDSKNFDDPQFGIEMDKNYFGSLVRVPIGTSKTVELIYTLPQNISENDYKLLIQKQAGLVSVPVNFQIAKDENHQEMSINMKKDTIVEKFNDRLSSY